MLSWTIFIRQWIAQENIAMDARRAVVERSWWTNFLYTRTKHQFQNEKTPRRQSRSEAFCWALEREREKSSLSTRNLEWLMEIVFWKTFSTCADLRRRLSLLFLLIQRCLDQIRLFTRCEQRLKTFAEFGEFVLQIFLIFTLIRLD